MAAWFNSNWKRRRKITVPAGKVSSSLTDFPLLVRLSEDEGIINHARVDGRDIVFTAADGVTPLSHEQIVHQKILRPQAVWTIWSDPRAIRYVGTHDKTYVAYYTTTDGWWISSYDHDDDTWEHFQLKGHNGSGRWWDDHNNPSIAILPDGRIIAVYNEHSTDRSWARTTVNPENISAWNAPVAFTGEQQETPSDAARRWGRFRRRWSAFTGERQKTPDDPAYSYNNLYCLPDGTLWRHYRPRTTWSGISRMSTVVKSYDGGSTWTDPIRMIVEPKRSPYLVTAQRGNKIHLFFSDAQPDEWDQTSVYHAYYDHSDESYRRSDGSLIGYENDLPFAPSDATKIFDYATDGQGKAEAWAYHVEASECGNVAVGFMVYDGEIRGMPCSWNSHSYWWARWDGSAWTKSEVATEEHRYGPDQKRYSGGIVVDPEDLSTCYVALVDPSVEENGFTRHIFKFTTPDNGQTWLREQVSRSGQGKQHGRPVVPFNRHPDLPVIWQYGHYNNYLEYWTMLVAGDHGELLESEHYVKIPAVSSSKDTEIYVYYDGPDYLATSPENVWPDSCALAIRGSFGDVNLGQVETEDVDALTVEAAVIIASTRRNSGDQDIVSNWGGPGFRLRKTGSQRLQTTVSTGGGTVQATHNDLTLPARSWNDTNDPLRMSFIQVKFVGGDRVHAWLNGLKSAQSPLMPSGIPAGSPPEMRIGYSPGDLSGGRFVGYLESLKVYRENLSDSWLHLSRQAEFDDSLLVRGVEEVSESSDPDNHLHATARPEHDRPIPGGQSG